MTLARSYTQEGTFTKGILAEAADTLDYSLQRYLDPATAPLGAVDYQADAIGLGCYSTIWDESIRRNLLGQAYQLYRNRDRLRGLDIYAAAVGVTYVAQFARSGGSKTGLTVCIAPPAAWGTDTARNLDEVLRAARWILPSDFIDIDIASCPSFEVDVPMAAAFAAITQYYVNF